MMSQLRLMTMIAKTMPGPHSPRISAQTVTYRLREIGEILPYTMHVLYEAFLFWPSISLLLRMSRKHVVNKLLKMHVISLCNWIYVQRSLFMDPLAHPSKTKF